MNSLKNEEIFIKDLINQFPQIEEEILDEDYSGLLTLQIGCFRRFTQDAIDRNDIDTVKRCFDFVESNVNKVEQKIENSLFITYLGKLNFKGHIQLEKLLSKQLKNVVRELNTYNLSNSKNENLNKFMDNL